MWETEQSWYARGQDKGYGYRCMGGNTAMGTKVVRKEDLLLSKSCYEPSEPRRSAFNMWPLVG